MKLLKATGSISNYQINAKTQNGERITLLVSAHLAKDEHNRSLRIEGILRDITEIEHMKESLQKALQDWQTTFDAVSDAICLLDNDQRILRCNRAMSEMFGVTQKEIVGRHCWEIVHGTKKPIPECPVTRTKRSLVREQMDLQRGNRWFSVTTDPILDENRTIQGTVHIVRDITGRKKAEKRCGRVHKCFKSLSDQAPVCVAMVDFKQSFYQMQQSVLYFLRLQRERNAAKDYRRHYVSRGCGNWYGGSTRHHCGRKKELHRAKAICAQR